jgi:hypothetical protein
LGDEKFGFGGQGGGESDKRERKWMYEGQKKKFEHRVVTKLENKTNSCSTP